jgi:hypothetical protein
MSDANLSGHAHVQTLPAIAAQGSTDDASIAASAATQDSKMTIAWRYQHLPQAQVLLLFCSSFLTSFMSITSVAGACVGTHLW